MLPTPEVADHVRELAAHIDGKDTRRLSERARGTALLLLDDERARTFRIRIELGEERATVALGGGGTDGDGLAVVRGAWSDWIAFYNNACAETLAPLKFYGEPELMAALGELLSTPRTTLDLRSGATR